ncbi:hypothetical protein EXIGLDRAFT_466759 [Exidia glandulosa HHB12029]|uniref:Uncharacterized protein n=1 Tax=Exidia glandulosa HHB12029 TaxID=1314781 RepID=A0A165AWK9_EXIGL|nr:hypothetical protein EXIGLDRAFT_466759 [Exidia glandulosa HHB12029]
MMLQLRNARHEDLRAYDSKPEPRPTQPVPAPAPAPVPVIPLPPPAARDDQSSSGDGSLYASETESEPSQLDPVEEALQVIARKVASVKNYVEIWLDLEQAGPDLHDPEALKPVLKNLRGCVHSCHDQAYLRVLAESWRIGAPGPSLRY